MLFDIGVTLKGKKSLPFLLTRFYAVLTLLLQTDLLLLSETGDSAAVSQLSMHYFPCVYVISFSFLACFLLACPPLLSTLRFSFLPYLPFFLYSTNICEIPRVYVCDKGTIKRFHGNRFISWSSPRTGGPHLRNSNAQLALALADFLRQNLEVPDSQISKHNNLFCLFHFL